METASSSTREAAFAASATFAEEANGFAAFAGGSAFAAFDAFAGVANEYLYVPDLRFPNCTEASTFRLVVAGGRWRSCRAACKWAHSC